MRGARCATWRRARTSIRHAIALCGSSLGGGVAVQAAAVDPRVGAVIVENGVANGERMIRSMHTRAIVEQISRARLTRSPATRPARAMKIIHRFDIFEMAKELQVNLTSNDSLMQFTADTALGFFTFRPEEFVATSKSAAAPHPAQRARQRDQIRGGVRSGAAGAMPPVELHLLDGTDHFMFVNPDPRVSATLRGWLDRYFPARRALPSC